MQHCSAESRRSNSRNEIIHAAGPSLAYVLISRAWISDRICNFPALSLADMDETDKRKRHFHVIDYLSFVFLPHVLFFTINIVEHFCLRSVNLCSFIFFSLLFLEGSLKVRKYERGIWIFCILKIHSGEFENGLGLGYLKTWEFSLESLEFWEKSIVGIFEI